MSKISIAPTKDEYMRIYGTPIYDIRCPRGHKLLEVEKKSGSVIWIKCKNCGERYRVEI